MTDRQDTRRHVAIARGLLAMERYRLVTVASPGRDRKRFEMAPVFSKLADAFENMRLNGNRFLTTE